MKKITLFVLLTLLALPAAAEPPQVGANDASAIKAATLDYLEGYYLGDGARMERALHPELAKRAVWTDRSSGAMFLRPIGYSALVVAAASGGGKLKEGEDPSIDVTILDVWGNMAMVKASSLRFMDYLQLAKLNGQWKIVNVLWEPMPPPAPPAP